MATGSSHPQPCVLFLFLLVPPQGRGTSLLSCWRDLTNPPRGYLMPPPGSLVEHASQKGTCCPSNAPYSLCATAPVAWGSWYFTIVIPGLSTRPARRRPGDMVQCLRTHVLTETQVHFFVPTWWSTTIYNSSLRESLLTWAPGTGMAHVHTYRQNTHTHEISKESF